MSNFVKKAIPLVATILLFSQMPAQGTLAGVSCVIPLHYEVGLMNLDFDEFRAGPVSWQQFANNGCPSEAGRLVRNYLNSHSDNLTPDQRRDLSQLLLRLGNVRLAS